MTSNLTGALTLCCTFCMELDCRLVPLYSLLFSTCTLSAVGVMRLCDRFSFLRCSCSNLHAAQSMSTSMLPGCRSLCMKLWSIIIVRNILRPILAIGRECARSAGDDLDMRSSKPIPHCKLSTSTLGLAKPCTVVGNCTVSQVRKLYANRVRLSPSPLRSRCECRN